MFLRNEGNTAHFHTLPTSKNSINIRFIKCVSFSPGKEMNLSLKFTSKWDDDDDYYYYYYYYLIPISSTRSTYHTVHTINLCLFLAFKIPSFLKMATYCLPI